MNKCNRCGREQGTSLRAGLCDHCVSSGDTKIRLEAKALADANETVNQKVTDAITPPEATRCLVCGRNPITTLPADQVTGWCKSLVINQKRFGIDEQLANILHNTAVELKLLKEEPK